MDERVIRAMRDDGYNVTAAQARIAQRIAADGSRLTDLAEQAQVTKQTASVLVAALEHEGFVERVPDPADGLARIIRFTQKGWTASDRAREVVMGVEQEWNDYLGPELSGCLRKRSPGSATSSTHIAHGSGTRAGEERHILAASAGGPGAGSLTC